jgi:dienelactone hydrolase
MSWTNAKYCTIICCWLLISCGPDDPEVCPELDVSLAIENFSNEINEGEEVTFDDNSTGDFDSRQWHFEGGFPEFTEAEIPTIVYHNPGTFNIYLRHFSECDSTEWAFVNKVFVNDIDTCVSNACVPSGYSIRGLTYGNNYSHHQGIFYQNMKDTAVSKPLILIFGGGGFITGGNLEQLEDLSLALVDRGYKVATLKHYYLYYNGELTGAPRTYRMIRANHSVKAAVRYFRRYETNYHIDTSKIVIGGFSSGATAALMSAYFGRDVITDEVLQNFGIDGGYEGDQGNEGFSSEASACIGIGGQINIVSGLDISLLLNESKDPVFGVCATNDLNVNCAVSMADAYLGFGANAYVDSARVYGMCADKYIYDGGDHHSGIDRFDEYIDQLDDFLIDVFNDECTNP